MVDIPKIISLRYFQLNQPYYLIIAKLVYS
jgi:hypothetical protein